jgi:hypothetical protein
MAEIVFPEKFYSTLSHLTESIASGDSGDEVIGWIGTLLEDIVPRFEPQDRRFVRAGIEKVDRIARAVGRALAAESITYNPEPGIIAASIIRAITRKHDSHYAAIEARLERNPVKGSRLEYSNDAGVGLPGRRESYLSDLQGLKGDGDKRLTIQAERLS